MIRAPATIPTIPGLQTALNGKAPSGDYLLKSGGILTGPLTGTIGAVEQRNDLVAQTLRVYGTYADASNYLRASLSCSATTIALSAQASGTGLSNANLSLSAAGNGTLLFYTGANLRGYFQGSNGLLVLDSAPGILFGSGTSSAVSILRGGAGLLYVTDGAGAFRDLKLRSLTATGIVRLNGYTVAAGANQLPAGTQGDTAFVTDAATPTFLSVVAGGGSVVTKVFFNGTSWICQ